METCESGGSKHGEVVKESMKNERKICYKNVNMFAFKDVRLD